MTTILISAPYMLPSIERFKYIFDRLDIELILPEVHERLSEDQLLKFAGQFDGAICGDDRYTEKVITACSPRLKVISKWGTGIDSINQDAARERGIKVCRTTNAFTIPVSDTVMGYILAFARRQPWLDLRMKQGKWEKIPGKALRECTLGVIGIGNIGKMLLRKAKAFDMTLIGNDIIEIDQAFINETGVEMTTLTDLMKRCDFISVNCDLNPTSYHLINKHTLSEVKTGAILINTARGPIVNELELIQSLQNGRLGGAALDVFEDEPLPHDSPLLKMDNVLLAPHNSNSSPEAWERVHFNTIINLIDGLGLQDKDTDLYQELRRSLK
jgi:D-3-phosphoglycerate dehydrogenase